ncbi:hypothetical protein FJTKL_08720 [Diaporthe vaccinii]|uniref:Glucose-methanol-choline oxidoreductase N-terminal domain-containing protein n=1 Tax=Diaporthe vaccinii TaxID=105482 RepID=A0ABR4EQK6_9PEZI
MGRFLHANPLPEHREEQLPQQGNSGSWLRRLVPDQHAGWLHPGPRPIACRSSRTRKRRKSGADHDQCRPELPCRRPRHASWDLGACNAPEWPGPTLQLSCSSAQETLNNKQWPLTLRTNALATKILFNTNSTSCGGVLKATGVEYLTGQSVYKADPRNNGAAGTKATARARKEVIVAGGTFNTPQLLQLSGIGPASLLTSLNIPVLVDSPGVGANLQDNQEMPVVGVSKNGQGSGAGYTFIKTNHSVTGERDLWMMHGGPFRGFWPPSTRLSNRPGPQDAAGTLSMSMVKQHVANRAGSVRITSTDPRDPPEINFRLYTQGRETDMGAVKDFVAWARRVHKATAAPVGPISTIEPPCPSGQDADGSCGQADEDWIEGQTFGHHCTSTAAIGAEGDANAVLDSKFRVRGVSGLRVADASVFPKIPGIFPAVATFMVGQKAGEVVIADATDGQC